MPNDTYVLDLLVTGAELVTIIDDGRGIDTISVLGLYGQTVEIYLSCLTIGGVSARAGGRYFDDSGQGHQLLITGLIEHALGSAGRDFLQGNEGANRLAGEADLAGPGGADTIWGGAGGDTLLGGGGADRLAGDGDDDLIFGGFDSDTVFGGTGRDTLSGGAGADWLYGGGEPGDMLSYKTSGAGVRIELSFGNPTLGQFGEAEQDQILGFTAIQGSAFRDTLIDRDKTTLADQANDNHFYGGAGADRLFLGGGNDLGQGGAGADLLRGEAGNDVLDGDDGDDWLSGGLGIDRLTGGAGADVFEFRSPFDCQGPGDTITDFSAAQGDRIDLAAMDAVVGQAGNQTFHIVTTDFQGTPGALRLVAQGNDLVLSGDVGGDGIADFAILILNLSGLSPGDILL